MSDNVGVNIHFANAKKLLVSALLPDRTGSRFVNAALDGTGRSKPLPETLKGVGEDLFEVVANPPKALLELGRGLLKR